MACLADGRSIFSELMWNRYQAESLASSSKGFHQNACYLDIPFDIEIELEGAGTTAKRKLETCFLGANDVAIAHDGKTLLDTYGFIARSSF